MNVFKQYVQTLNQQNEIFSRADIVKGWMEIYSFLKNLLAFEGERLLLNLALMQHRKESFFFLFFK